MNMALGEYSANMTSADFVEILKRADDSYEEAQNKDIEVDILVIQKIGQKLVLPTESCMNTPVRSVDCI